MKYFLAFLTIITISGCNWMNPSPSGTKSIEGSFIYFDFNQDTVVLRLKSERSFLVEIPTKSLIKVFFDKRQSIPFEGSFKAEVIYDAQKRIDYMKIKSLNDASLELEVKAKDVN